jgi:CO/xanthine dehydrogenase Mo-binding subunit
MAIGKAIPMLDAVERVTGNVPYAASLTLPGMLVGRVFRSPVPHAHNIKLDTSAAEALPGVVTVFTAADFKDKPSLNLHYGSSVVDQPIVADDRIRYVGEPLALIAAENARIAEAALDLIELDYEELPAVTDVEEAMQPEAPTLHPGVANNIFKLAKIRHGDPEAGFAAADEIIEEVYTSPLAQPTHLEPQVCAAQWLDGQLTLWTGAQSPFTVRKVLAAIFDLDPEDVRVIVPSIGGGFGAKGNVRIQPLAAALAWKAGGRPVKLALRRDEEFVTVTKHAAKIMIKTGVKRDGAFTARQVTIYWNGGAYVSSSAHLVPAGMLRSIGPYRLPAVKVDSYGVYTNLPQAAAYRGAMSSQGTWAHESHLDTIAHRLGLDPVALRRKNLLRSGEQFATGETLHDIHFVECLNAALAGLDSAKLTGQLQPSASDQRAIKRGRGVGVMMKHTIANSRSECRLTLDAQGGLRLFTSAVEMGQGTHTALAQIAAEAVGVPLKSISVVGPDTARTPFDSQTAGSRATTMMGSAVLYGAARLKQDLIAAAVPYFEQPAEELIAENGHVFSADGAQARLTYADVLRWNRLETIEARGEYSTNEGKLDPETGQGVSTPHWHQGAGACEIELDTETGKVTVVRYHSAAFAGRIVNPNLVKLQNDGNVIFGLGPTFLEEMVVDGGQIVNPNLSDYMIPSFLDVPLELENSSLEREGSGFHGVGEMTLPPVAPAVANAIFDAVGVRIRDLPITPEKVLRALEARKDER